jgi:23S rRNA (cytosine1962-C5)-methyltransferase
MPDDKFLMFRNRLTKVFRHKKKQAKALGVSCYRVYDHDLTEFPLSIEVYEDKLYVAEYQRRHGMTESEHTSWMEGTLAVISEITGIMPDQTFLRLRTRKPGRLGQYLRQDESGKEFIVNENGLRFIINLTDYLDTGLFLDHRMTREIVKKESKGKKVLNLFAYTGSFSVYAVAGGAALVDTVDLSKTYLSWAERNMQLNGFKERDRFGFIHADVVQFLQNLKPSSYDLIIMDPPTFSNSQRMEGFLDIQRDHVKLINDCLRALVAEGVLYFSTNFRKFELEEEKINAATARDMTKSTTPFDFAGTFSRFCYKITKNV